MGASRGGIVDLPTPKRAANAYVGQLAGPRADQVFQESSLEMAIDGELPALLSDLDLDDPMDPALLSLESAGARSSPMVLALDLSDLPAPVGPRPRSPLSTRGDTSPAPVSTRLPTSSPRVGGEGVVARGPASWPGLLAEPEPLPAPPAREPLTAPGVTLPSGADAQILPRHEPLVRPPIASGLLPPPLAERTTVPSAIFPPALRDTMPVPRRVSTPGLPVLAKPVHMLFDSSEPALTNRSSRAAESTPTLLPLPPLPSDESGGPRPTAASASASVSDPSGLSVITGAPGASSIATTEPRPLRLGYLITGLAVLALLLAVIIARIAGIWNQQSAPISEPAPANPPGEPGRRPLP